METPQRRPDVERLRQESRNRYRALEKKVKDLPKDAPWPKILLVDNEVIGPRNSVNPVSVINEMIPSLKEDQAVALDMDGFFFNNTGAARTFSLGIGFGQTTVYGDISGSLTSVATARPWTAKLRFTRVTREGLAFVGYFKIPTATAAVVGAGDLATAAIDYVVGSSGIVAADFSGRNRLDVGLLLSFASANLYMEAHRRVLYIE